jgi:hypothetical protein
MQKTGYRTLSEALVFAHGDKACEEAKRQFELNERSGNVKLAEDWAMVINQMPACHLPQLHQAA